MYNTGRRNFPFNKSIDYYTILQTLRGETEKRNLRTWKCNFMQIILRNLVLNDRSSVSNYPRFQLQYEDVWELTTKNIRLFVLIVYVDCM